MRLGIDLTGSNDARDDLDYLQDARQAVHDLLLPDCDLDRAGRERLCTLLTLIAVLEQAARALAFDSAPQKG